MQQIQTDPNKSALIQATTAGLADDPDIAMDSICKLSMVLPVYIANIPDLETASKQWVSYIRDHGPIPDWYKHSLGQ